MNLRYEAKEIRYNLLKVLSKESLIGQREMAKKLGISLGKVNYCLTELTKKGFIKVTRYRSSIKRIPYTYIITVKGLEEKARLTVSFLKRKAREYEEIKRRINELEKEVEEEKLMVRSGSVKGISGDLAELY